MLAVDRGLESCPLQPGIFKVVSEEGFSGNLYEAVSGKFLVQFGASMLSRTVEVEW